jgi:hypothetical protein
MSINFELNVYVRVNLLEVDKPLARKILFLFH